MVLSLAGMTVAGFAFDERVVIVPASLLSWICAITLLIVAAVAGYWVLLSRFTTLTVTNNRTIYQLGIISRQTSENQHDDMRNIQVVVHRLPHPQRIIELIRENQE